MTLDTQAYDAAGDAAGPGAAGSDISGLGPSDLPPGAAQSWRDAMGRADVTPPAADRTQLADAGGDWAKFVPPAAADAALPALEGAAPAEGLAARLLPLLGRAAGIVGAGAGASQFDAMRADGQVAEALGKFGLDPQSPTDVAAASAYVWGRNEAPISYNGFIKEPDVPWGSPAHEAVAVALLRNEQAHPGTLAAALRHDPAAGAAIDQVVADAVHLGGLAADAGGATGKLPPGPPPNVRVDGECDKDANVGKVSPTVRLPTSNGAWLGEAGNSGWLSTREAVNIVTGGKPIPFVNGRPDFTQWSKMSINFRPRELTGDPKTDTAKAARELSTSDSERFPTIRDAEKWIKTNKLTAHHANDTCLQLVPIALNKYVAHVGGAADIKLQRRAP